MILPEADKAHSFQPFSPFETATESKTAMVLLARPPA
jgi:hypothetical protein